MATTSTIAKPEGATHVVHKDEGEGEVGPVWFILNLPPETDDFDLLALSKGEWVDAYTDTWTDKRLGEMSATGWMTRSEAKSMAKHFGLRFADV